MNFEHMYDMSYEEAFKNQKMPSNEPKRVDMGELVLQEDGTYCAVT